MSREEHLPHVVNHLRYMARTGTVGHIDFREQGPYGSELLREASRITGIDSVILGQFSGVPFDEAALDANRGPSRGARGSWRRSSPWPTASARAR
jgi:5-methylthioadenosine/S-adenosylhomocysteine deaminase